MPRYDDDRDKTILLTDGLIAKTTAGSIERMEAEGQRAIVVSTDLPTNIGQLTREEITKHTGIVFGDAVNELFVAVTLPNRWSKRATDHSMHSEVIDGEGRVRASIFYKAAFYDRRANIYFTRFYNACYCYNGDELHGAEVKDANGIVIEHFPRQDDENEWAAHDRAVEWLDQHFAEHNSPWAYWEPPQAP